MTPEAERELLEVAGTVGRVLEDVSAAAYVVDGDGVFRWLNRRAIELIGNAVGKRFATVVAPDDLNHARCQFAKKLIGSASSTDYLVSVMANGNGRVPLRITSAPIRTSDHRIVGVFGLAWPAEPDVAEAAEPVHAESDEILTPRQHEVLRLLDRGAGTGEIAASLGVAEETARNHIRRLLARLGVHSRLAAVAAGRSRGLI